MKSLILLHVALFLSLTCIAQITLGEIEKNIQIPVLKPEPFDSTANFVNEERRIDYLKYIGQQFYLPPIKKGESTNKIIFTRSPNITPINTDIYSDRKITKKLDAMSVFDTDNGYKSVIHSDIVSRN